MTSSAVAEDRHGGAAPGAPPGFIIPVLGAILAVTVIRIGALIVSPFSLSFDEAQYWLWSRDLDWGYFSKPPLVAWAIAGAAALCGDGPACVRLVSPLSHAATALILYIAGARLFLPAVGAWAALLWLLLPGVSFSAMLVSTDPPLLMFWAAALFAGWRAAQGGGGVWWVATGVAVGLGVLAKYAMLAFLPCYLAFLLWEKRRLPAGVWAMLAVAACLVSPNLAWNAAHHFATIGHTGANANLSGPLFNPDRLLEFLGGQAGVFGPLTLVGFLAACLSRSVWGDRRGRYLLWLALPMLLVMIGQSFLSRANANWAAVAYVSATLLVAAWAYQGRRWLVRLAMVTHILAACLLYGGEAVATAAGHPPSGPRDPFKRVRAWPETAAALRPAMAANPDLRPLFDDRELMANLVYHLRPDAFGAVKWNDAGRVRDHFEMTTDMERHKGEGFLLITQHPDAGHVAKHFAGVHPLGAVTVAVNPRLDRTFRLYRLDGFLGYGR